MTALHERLAETAVGVTSPENFPAGTPFPGRELNAAQGDLPRPPAAAAPGEPHPARGGDAPAAAVYPPGGGGGPSEPAGGEAHPASSPAASPVPGRPPAGTGDGKVEPISPGRSRARKAAPAGEPGSTPSRARREGTAAPGPAHPGAARTSRPAPEGDAGRVREGRPGATPPVRGAGSPPPAQGQAGGAPDRASAPPAGQPQASAGAEFRRKWKAAESAGAAARRNGRGRYPQKRTGDGYRAGMARRYPGGEG